VIFLSPCFSTSIFKPYTPDLKHVLDMQMSFFLNHQRISLFGLQAQKKLMSSSADGPSKCALSIFPLPFSTAIFIGHNLL